MKRQYEMKKRRRQKERRKENEEKKKERNKESEKKENNMGKIPLPCKYLSLTITSIPFHFPSCLYQVYHSTPSLPNSIYPFLPSLSTSFGRIIRHQWYLSLYILSNCLYADFAFNQVIPLEIVSFYSFSYLITMHPKIGNPFVMHSLREKEELREIVMHQVASK